MNKIIETLINNDKFALFTHVSPDGDALGSIFSLALVLQCLGKKADVYISGDVPKRLKFMADHYAMEYFTCLPEQKKEYFCCIAVDSGDVARLGIYKEMFEASENTINIDHHVSNIGYAKYNLVCPDASSTGEVLFDIYEKMNIKWTEQIASLLYGSVASDTGSFCFSNTTPKTHAIAGVLIENGADYVFYNKKLFVTNTKSALKAQSYVIDNMKYYFDGKAAFVTVDDKVLRKIGATKEDTEGLIDILKSVEDVEIGILLKQVDKNTKVSVRTNFYIDAVKLCSKFGGGGHIRAAGCTLQNTSVKKAKCVILKALEEFFWQELWI